ncbi:MAG: DUF1405 domain-containing protein [Dethiobacter sp.]|nr:DUF1405 domain-containing protein [Dethiobacter sp.]
MRRLIESFLSTRWLYPALLAGNFCGAVYGFYWYAGQFAETPLYLWLFLPNSPLPILYFLLALLFLRRKRRSRFFEGLAYFGLIKHGLWTVVLITLYQLAGSRQPENIWLIAGHGLMALQAVLCWYYFGLPLTVQQAAAVSAWYFFDDFLDYVVGIHPRIDPSLVSLATTRNIALALSLLLTAAYLLSAERSKNAAGSSGPAKA